MTLKGAELVNYHLDPGRGDLIAAIDREIARGYARGVADAVEVASSIAAAHRALASSPFGAMSDDGKGAACEEVATAIAARCKP